MEIKRDKEVEAVGYAKCHDGEGTLFCKSILEGFGGRDLRFMHSDFMAAGVSIGYHFHDVTEEIYYLQSGKGILSFDGKEFEMYPGDVSLCTRGHSHGFKAVEDCVLLVVGGRVCEE